MICNVTFSSPPVAPTPLLPHPSTNLFFKSGEPLDPSHNVHPLGAEFELYATIVPFGNKLNVLLVEVILLPDKLPLLVIEPVTVKLPGIVKPSFCN